jgi:hypothetical protein
VSKAIYEPLLGRKFALLRLRVFLYYISLEKFVHNFSYVGFFVPQASIHNLNSTKGMINFQLFGSIIAIGVLPVSCSNAILKSATQKPICRNGAFALIYGFYFSAAGCVFFEHYHPVIGDGCNQLGTGAFGKYQNILSCIQVSKSPFSLPPHSLNIY